MFINLRETEDSKIYITSDPHLGHQRDFVWKVRGYNSAEEHTNDWFNKTNAVVNSNDILICLGDFCLNTPLAKFNEYLSRINCQTLLCLWGNHNNPHEKAVYNAGMDYKLVRGFPVMNYPFAYRNMVYLPHYVEAALNGQFAVLCHYPISIWNELQNGSWMLCGHSHYGFEPSRAESLAGKILDVGWDGHKAPWSLQEIAAVMAKKGITKADHHVPGMGK
jgi:calcineurin-like phosphoesterase family protein